MTKSNESLYIKILLWCYEKHQGFTEQELIDAFNLNNEQELRRWYEKVFKAGTINNSPMISHFYTRKEKGYWCLTEKGMSAAIDYIELKEARESSKNAMRVATLALVVAIVVGIAQILVQICF